MAVILGKDVTISKNDVTIAKVRSGSFTGNANTIDLNALGDEWESVAVGLRGGELTAEVLTIGNNTEQNALFEAWRDGTKLTNMKVHLDSTSVIQADTVEDSDAGVYITSWSANFAIGDALSQSITMKFTGAIDKLTS